MDIIHAGWRGTREGIIRNTVVKMQKYFSTNPFNLQVAFGPGIGECCYEVKEDFQGYFPEYILERKSRLFFNLKKKIYEILQSLGVREENFLDSEICTFCQNRDFFSYRREGKGAGRTISVIMLK